MKIYCFTELENWEPVGTHLGERAHVCSGNTKTAVLQGNLATGHQNSIEQFTSYPVISCFKIYPQKIIKWGKLDVNRETTALLIKEKPKRPGPHLTADVTSAVVDPRLWNMRGPLETTMQVYVPIFFQFMKYH